MHTSFSIVVPFLDDEAAFETSLVSVLENRPNRSEVVVVHDGSYADPFDLGDEVRFVVAEGARGGPAQVVELIHAAIEHIHSDVVHILGGGLQATDNWYEPALDHFVGEQCAAVAPVVRCDAVDGVILHAGMFTGWSQPCCFSGHGRQSLNQKHLGSVHAPLLLASFWRTEVLDCVVDHCRQDQLGQRELALFAGYALRGAGLECHIAPQATLISDVPIEQANGFQFGRSAQTIRSIARGATNGAALGDALFGLAAAIPHPDRWSNACGRLFGGASSAGARQLRHELDNAIIELRGLQHDPAIFSLPVEALPVRRAA